MKEKKTETVIIRITEQMKSEIEALAKACRRSVSNYLRLLIHNAICRSKGLPEVDPGYMYNPFENVEDGRV